MAIGEQLGNRGVTRKKWPNIDRLRGRRPCAFGSVISKGSKRIIGEVPTTLADDVLWSDGKAEWKPCPKPFVRAGDHEISGATGGHLEEDICVGKMVVKIYRNHLKNGRILFKCRLQKKLPEDYKKSLGETITEHDLSDAMRALYRAQRYVKKRRRQLGLCRGVFTWLP